MHILINGAGIAGLTLAYWLNKFGFIVSVVDKRPDLQDAGYMIDFYGPGFDVAEKMSVLDQLLTWHYPIKDISFIDRYGKTRSSIDIEKFRRLLHFRHFNFMRGDLAIVLFEMVKDTAPIQFDTSVSQIQQRSDGVHVAFTDGTKKDCDLVVGADGIHSKIRQLVWSDKKQFEHFLGYYVACSIVEDRFGVQKSVYSHIEPGSHAAVYPSQPSNGNPFRLQVRTIEY
ncbi:MAG: FAD-dependent monooxygenase [Chloroflexota bacterium]